MNSDVDSGDSVEAPQGSDDTQESSGDNQQDSDDNQDSGDSAKAMRRADGKYGQPNPHWNTGCENSHDCAGLSVYCYRDYPRNRCRYGNGIGSLCQTDESCGWLGRGSWTRQMFCT